MAPPQNQPWVCRVCARVCVCYCIRNAGFGDAQRRKTRSQQSASPRNRLRRREADAGPGRPLPFRRRVDGSAESGSASGGCVYITSRALATCGEAGTTPLSLPARTPEVREVRVGAISRGTLGRPLGGGGRGPPDRGPRDRVRGSHGRTRGPAWLQRPTAVRLGAGSVAAASRFRP